MCWISVPGADAGAVPGMLLHKGDRVFHGLHGEGVDLDLRHEAKADQGADEIGEPLHLTLQIRSEAQPRHSQSAPHRSCVF